MPDPLFTHPRPAASGGRARTDAWLSEGVTRHAGQKKSTSAKAKSERRSVLQAAKHRKLTTGWRRAGDGRRRLGYRATGGWAGTERANAQTQGFGDGRQAQEAKAL